MPDPQRIKGRYEVKDVLGRGGMGVVYRAYDTVVRRDVALKTLLDAPDRAALDLFYKECDVLASMSHPNIVEIFDLGEFEEEGASKPYFVMPLLPGVTLEHLIRTSSHRLTVERSLEIISQTCRGLQAAHERGLVHRDMKPSNIFVLDDDSVKIIDFGVAHMVDTRSTMGHKGTLLYMAPEQIEMKAPSPLSDIFALGVVSYETLTRRRPFERATTPEIAQAILKQIPPPASEINPSVSQAVSRVVHKAMAKQPWHRFSNAREFADTLNKAYRNEAIEFFDVSRIQPRIQRATKAFESGDYQFAGEILTELEAEGHVDASISLLRRQIDQTVRQRTILQLLESARTRYEQEEYPLALQKLQEVLDLDPNNAAALSLKGNIEGKRSESKIDDWFRLARQHLDNQAFGHARQALQNVLQQKPGETRALQLLADVDRREQSYVKVRKEKEQLYESSLEAWQNGEISVALSRLERLLDLDKRSPDTSAPDRGATFQKFYNQVRSDHDALRNGYDEARKNLAEGNFRAALALCDEWLQRHPGHALFQALKFDIEERERQGLSARIAEVDRKVEAEPDLDRRVAILQEEIDRHPDEAHFERSLRLLQDKRDLVNSIVTKARNLEERGQFGEALGQWEILKTIYSQYPGLAFEVERVVRRRDQQARNEAKARWVEQIDRQLEGGEHGRAMELVAEALLEFPDDGELTELEKLAKQGLDRAIQAQGLLEEGRQLCAEAKTDQGLETLERALALDERSPVIRGVLLEILLAQARARFETDWQAADQFVTRALALDSTHVLARSLSTLVNDKKRETFVDQCVAEARALQTAGEVFAALDRVEKGIAAYPRELRLAQLHTTLNKALPEGQRRMHSTGIESRIERAGRPAPSADANAETILDLEAAGLAAASAAPPAAPPESAAPAAPPPAPAPPVAPPPPEPVSAAPPPPPVAPPPSASAVAAAVPPPPKEKPVPVKPAVTPPKPPSAAPAKAPAGKKSTLLWVAAAVVLLAAGAFLIPKLRKGGGSGAAVAVAVRTTPSGASIKVNNEVRGVSDLNLDLAPGTYQVEALIDGYRPAVATVTVEPGKPAPAPVALVLQPFPEAVRLFTDLDAGQVALDDKPAGELQDGQLVLDDVAPGAHALQVKGRRGEAILRFEVTPGSAPKLTAPVEAKELVAVLVTSLGGRVRVQASGGPVKASLDGRALGEAGPEGLEITGVAAGGHELVLGEGAAERRMVVETGPAPALTAFLKSDRNVGTLVVLTGEDGVKVFLNGKEQRRTSRRGQLRIPNLDVADYKVHVAKEGYQEEPEQQASIRKGGEAKVEFHLRPVPSVASLVIRGAVAGAEVTLDKRSLGTVAADGTLSASNITPGEHTIEIRKDQFRPRQIHRPFAPGGTVQLDGAEVSLERLLATLHVNVSPAEARVTIARSGETPRAVADTTLTLSEGTYTLTGRAPEYGEKSVTVQLGPGETKSVDLQLTAQKKAAAVVAKGMGDWENPAAWAPDGNWHTRRGGNFTGYKANPVNGTFIFTAALRRGRRLQWVVERADDKNYVLLQMDKRFFYRNQVVNGKSTELAKVPHGQDKQDYYTLQVDVTNGVLTHRIQDGGAWKVLDEWKEPARNFTAGQFGFLIPGSDQVALSNFSFLPR